MLVRDSAARGRPGRDQLVPWRYQFRLDDIVVVLYSTGVRPIAARGTARTECGDGIVCARSGAEGIAGADGDRRRFIAGRMDLTVGFMSQTILAIVAGCGYHGYPEIKEPFYGYADGIIVEGFKCWSTPTKIDYANVMRLIIECY